MANNTPERINFSSIKSVIDYPDFLDVQLKSFVDFFQLDTPSEKRNSEGLYKVFMENFPISDSRENFVLEFVDYTVDPPKYSVDESIERGLTYSVPLKAKLRLLCNDAENEDFETIARHDNNRYYKTSIFEKLHSFGRHYQNTSHTNIPYK